MADSILTKPPVPLRRSTPTSNKYTIHGDQEGTPQQSATDRLCSTHFSFSTSPQFTLYLVKLSCSHGNRGKKYEASRFLATALMKRGGGLFECGTPTIG